MTKLLRISEHYRRAPSKPEVYLRKHEQLREEVFVCELESALEEAIRRDESFLATMGGY